MTLKAVPSPVAPRPKTGADALDLVEAFLRRFLAFPSQHAFVAVALWAAHTHAIGAFYVTPRLVLDSAEPSSGKTRVLEVLNLVCSEPELMLSATTAAIFRMLDDQPYTLLFDEVDAIFNPKNGGNNEDLRALLNSGYKRGASIARCVGDAKSMKVQRFKVFAPVALAGLAGNLPATITTRSVTVHMRKRAPHEKVEQFRERDAEIDAKPIKDTLGNWAGKVYKRLESARPDMPEGVVDRAAELWESLLAVADVAGGDWPDRGREACRYFVLGSDPAELSRGVRLLRDIQRVFAIRDGEGRVIGQRDHMPSQALVDALVGLDESPWADMRGRPLDMTRLAREVKKYGVEPLQYKADGVKSRGYLVRGDANGEKGLADAWSRYLPSEAGTSGTAGTGEVNPVPGQQAVPGLPGTGTEPGTA